MDQAKEKFIRVRVAAIIRNQKNEILLVEQRKDPAKPSYFLLPGGGVEFGENLVEALQRELKEEINFVAEKLKFSFIQDLIDPNFQKHLIQIVFETECSNDFVFQSNDPSILSISFHPESKLNHLDIRPEIHGVSLDKLDQQYYQSKWISG
jgi:8-oxo-dGTP diphosphatase